jgi:hypothetical protein
LKTNCSLIVHEHHHIVIESPSVLIPARESALLSFKFVLDANRTEAFYILDCFNELISVKAFRF